MIPQPDLTEAYKHLHLSLTKIEKDFNTIHFTYTTKRTEMVKGQRKRDAALGGGVMRRLDYFANRLVFVINSKVASMIFWLSESLSEGCPYNKSST